MTPVADDGSRITARELRADLLRRAGAGTPTASDAEEPPVAPQNRTPWSGAAVDLAEVTEGPGDPHWRADRDLIDGTVRDPYEREWRCHGQGALTCPVVNARRGRGAGRDLR